MSVKSITDDLDYFYTYKREVKHRANSLARMSARRELVEICKHIMKNPTYDGLARGVKREIADEYLKNVAEIVSVDPGSFEITDPEQVMHEYHEIKSNIKQTVKNRINSRCERMERRGPAFARGGTSSCEKDSWC